MSDRRLTKHERREQARHERRQLLQAQRRHALHRKIWIAVGVVAACVATVAIAFLPQDSEQDSTESPDGVRDFAVSNQNHVDGVVDYPQDPPVGGDHNPTWLNCGYYDQRITKENAVHSMEHGAAWITYRPGLSQEEVQLLRDAASGQDFIVVSPYPELRAPVVSSSWGHQLELDGADDPRLQGFLRAFRLGPDTPEIGAPCTGGTGIPAG